MEYKMELASFMNQKEENMKENLDNLMELENLLIFCEYMKDNLKKMKEMDIEYFLIKIILFTKDNFLKQNLKELEIFKLMQILDIKVIGKKEFHVVHDFILIRQKK